MEGMNGGKERVYGGERVSEREKIYLLNLFTIN